MVETAIRSGCCASEGDDLMVGITGRRVTAGMRAVNLPRNGEVGLDRHGDAGQGQVRYVGAAGKFLGLGERPLLSNGFEGTDSAIEGRD